MTMTAKGQSGVRKRRMRGSRIDEFKRCKVSDRTLPLCPRPVCIHRVPWCALTSFMGNVADRVDYSPFFVVSAQPRKPTPSTPFTHFLWWHVCKVTTGQCLRWIKISTLKKKLHGACHCLGSLKHFSVHSCEIISETYYLSCQRWWTQTGTGWLTDGYHLLVLLQVPQEQLEGFCAGSALWAVLRHYVVFTYTHSTISATMVMEERWAMSHSSPLHGLFVSNEWWLLKRKEFQNKGVQGM